MVIDNRPGAGSMIGTDAVAKSAPDGYRLLLADMPHTIVPAVYGKARFAAAGVMAPAQTGPVALHALIDADLKRWAKIVRDANINAN